jgi:hypothetical protein
MRPPMGSHQSGQPAWPPYGVGEGMPWGNFIHSFSRMEKHVSLVSLTRLVLICRRNWCAFVHDGRFALVPSKERLWEHSIVWTQMTAIHCQDKLFVWVKSDLRHVDFFSCNVAVFDCPIGSSIVKTDENSMI